eukprot:729877-Amphidinium_carterae.1
MGSSDNVVILGRWHEVTCQETPYNMCYNCQYGSGHVVLLLNFIQSYPLKQHVGVGPNVVWSSYQC